MRGCGFPIVLAKVHPFCFNAILEWTRHHSSRSEYLEVAGQLVCEFLRVFVDLRVKEDVAGQNELFSLLLQRLHHTAAITIPTL